MSSSLQFVEAVEQKPDPTTNLRQLFETRYVEIFGWALRLTRSDRAAAAELVHDAYVDLATALPDLRTLSNLDGYLYRALRNLHCTQIRRSWRHEHSDLEMLDYDSLHIRLRVNQTADQVEFQNQILQLCHFLCWRKAASKSASVLLLRFFRGFLPEEIMAIAGLSRASVDSQIRLARREGKSFLEKPGKFDLSLSRTATFRAPIEADDFLPTLQRVIRAAGEGECLVLGQEGRDASLYSALTTAQLSHVASCDHCLSSITQRLGIDPPSDRWPLDGGGSEWEPQRAKQSLRELGAHQPKSFQLAVNGEEFRSWRTAPAHSLSVSSEIRYLELFSEQGVRLLYLDLEPGSPCGEQRAKRTVRLGRELALDVSVERYGTVAEIRTRWRKCSPPRASIYSGRAGLMRKLAGWFALPSVRAVAAVTGCFLLGLVLFWTLRFASGRFEEKAVERVLDRAVVAERELSTQTTRQVLQLEEEGSGNALPIERVEVVHASGVTRTRLYDDSGGLIQERAVSQSETFAECLARAGIWACELSPQELKKRNGSVHLEQEAGTYRIEYRMEEDSASPVAPNLVKAVLILDSRTLHIREQRLWMISGGEVRVYRFRELRFEKGIANPASGTSLATPRSARRPEKRYARSGAREKLPHLILAAMRALRDVGGDVDLSLTFERLGRERLRVGGTLSSASEARAVRQALAPLANTDILDLEIHSAEEGITGGARPRSLPVVLSAYEVNASATPVDAELRQLFRRSWSSEDQLDHEIHLFTEAVLGESAAAHRDGWRLQQLLHVLTPDEVVSLNSQDRQVWLALLDDSLGRLRLDLASLDGRLGSLPFPDKPNSNLPTTTLPESRPYVERVEEIVRRTRRTEDELIRLFTVRAGAQDEEVPTVEDAVQHLKTTELLLSQIEGEIRSSSTRK